MGFFSKLFGRSASAPAQPAVSEHAVLVYLKLSGTEFGTESERQAVHSLTDELEAAIVTEGAGEFDGDEFGAGGCTLYMYGPDADRLFAAVESLLKGSPLTKGAHAIKRYGAASDSDAREVRVDFAAGAG
jgi:hypothetical protein